MKWNFTERGLSKVIILRAVRPSNWPQLDIVVHSSRHSSNRRAAAWPGRGTLFRAMLCAAALLAAGCHSNNQTSGYGIVWVTVTDDPGDFTSYITSVASLTMTRSDGQIFTAIATEEPVDFTTLGSTSELWASASIPSGTYTAATITLDYTNASAALLGAGAPTMATLTDPTGAALTTVPVTVTFDPANPLVIASTYATTSAVRLAIDFNVAASNVVNTATAAVAVKPFLTANVVPADTKPIRVRGPLINSSASLGTYTVYVRPFHDELNALGTLTIFNSASTIYTLDGTTYVGTPGLNLLTQAPAGTTMTAAYTTLQPTTTPSATAGIFNSIYVLAGSSLENSSTVRLSGDVIQRSGGILTLRGSTLSTPDGTFTYGIADAIVEVGAATKVTEDGQATLAPLDQSAIAVGQHIEAVGNYSLSAGSVVTLDATAGKVRLQPTEVYGSLLAAAAGGVTLNLLAIDNYPAGIYTFAGNGTTAAQDTSSANYRVNTGSLALPAGTIPGAPLWIDGFTGPFGGAPPDFNAVAVTVEASQPASLRATWVNGGSTTPFAGLAAGGFSFNLADPNLSSAVIRIGPESIPLSTLVASPAVVPTTAAVTNTYSPLYAVGNAANGISVYSNFGTFVTQLNSTFAAAKPAQQLEARGVYNRATNTFIANTVNVVL